MSEEASAGTVSPCNSAADSAAIKSCPESFIKLETQTTENHSLRLQPWRSLYECEHAAFSATLF